MRKLIIPVFFYMSFFLVLTAFSNANKIVHFTPETLAASSVTNASVKENTSAATLSTMLYDKLHLENEGLSKEVLELAVTGYEKLVDKNLLHNTQYLTIVDFSQSSRKKRFYLLDVKNLKLAVHTFVAHGKNSGLDRAESFSNIPESEKSSLGFYVTKGTYSGKHGLSLKLSGLEKGFNHNAESRAIVVHGAEYVNSGRVHSAYMGRSQGCPAVPQAESAKVISLIKNGSALFIYHPTKSYLNGSRLLSS